MLTLALRARAAIALALLVVAASQAAAQNVAPPLEPVTLQLKWKHQFQFAGYYAAIEKGFYREAGLEVRLLEAPNAGEPAERVLSGQAQYGIATSDLVLLHAAGHKVVALGAIFQHSALSLLALQDAGIDTLHHLAGRRVMIEHHAAELLAYLKAEGVALDALQRLDHSFDPWSLMRGEVEAISAYSTDEPFLVERAGRPYRLFSPRAGGIDFYGDTLFTTERQLRERPEQVRAFYDASLRGWAYALAHPEEIIDLIHERYSRRHDRDHLAFEAKRTAALILPELVPLGFMNPGRWRHIADTYAAMGMVPADLSLDGFLWQRDAAPDLTWLYGALAGISLLVLAGGAASAWYWRLSRRLESDVREQRRLQGALAVAERRARESEAQIRSVAENLPGAVVRIERSADNALLLSFASPGLQPLVGIDPASVLGNPERALDIVPERHRARFLSELARSANMARRLSFEYDTALAGGEERWLRLLASPRKPGDGTTVWDGLLLDSTEWRRADQAKRSFVSTVSHELRTPLTAIRGALGLIAGGAMGEIPERARNLVEIANSNCLRLTRLINDILDIEKIESERFDFTMGLHGLPELLAKAADAVRSMATPREVAIEIVEPVEAATVRVDPDRFLQVMSNLLSNAVKFSPPGGVVRIRAGLNGQRLRISVEDQGPGIPSEFRTRLFQRFSQANTRDDRARGGTGLGLSIAKAIVERFAGRIGFDTGEGGGTVFWFELPLIRPLAEGAATVLVVEDEPALAELYATALMEQGVNAVIAHNAADAMAILAERPIAAMLLDLLLPDRDGLQLLAELRADPAFASLPVIIASGRSDDAGAPAAAALGVHTWLRKPVDVREMAGMIRGAAHLPRGGRTSLLHVEDDPSIATLLEQAMEGHCDVVNARSLSVARALLKAHPFDMVILDLGLPDGDGADLLADLARLKDRPAPPVIILSARDADREMSGQVAHVLTKSKTSLDTVVETVRRHLERNEGAEAA